MGGSSSPAPAPAAPDPVATAKAQGVMNKETAVAQTGLNAINQYTPDGSLEYTQGGTWADGTPRFTATTNLSPASQAIFDTNKITQQNIATIGKDQSARIGDLLGKPLKLGNEAVEARLMELGSARLNPQFARNEEATRTRLLNSGIRQGSDAWAAEMGTLGQNKNDAINQLLLAGRGQANQEIMSERNQPINEITALMSGSQVSNPAFASTPQSQVAGVDYMGAVNNNYNQQMSAWNAQNANAQSSNNAMMGGMFGLGGTIGSAALKYGGGAALFSDRRLKTDIVPVGTLDNGLTVYSYRFIDGGPTQIGLMADEVERVNPDAVTIAPNGFKMVDYAQAVEA